MIVVTKNAHKLKFNKEIKMKNSFVYGVMLAIKPDKDYLLATVTMANCHRLQDINTLHQKLGHASKALMQKMQNFTAGNSKVSLNFVRTVSPPSFIRKTPTKRRRHGARCQASGCLLTSAMSKAEASEACSTGYSLLTMQWISVSVHS